ncbi:MAG: hypothetical protein ACK2T6_08325 [Anaerolineae bacterium]
MREITAHLDDALRPLTRGPQSETPHQQTIRATMDWSRDLLDAPEQLLLDRL